MAKSKTKSRVSNNTKKSGFKFRWWMAGIVVIVVAIVGIAVLRFSHASTTTSFAYKIHSTRYNQSSGEDYKYYVDNVGIPYSGQDVTIKYHHTERNGIVIYTLQNANVYTCGYIFQQGAYGGGFKDGNARYDRYVLHNDGTYLFANSTCDQN